MHVRHRLAPQTSEALTSGTDLARTSSFPANRFRVRQSVHSEGSPSDPQATKAWVVGDDQAVAIIDPGEDSIGILDAVKDRHVVAVICTQGSRAHTAAAIDVAWALCAPVLLHPADHALWENTHDQSLYW